MPRNHTRQSSVTGRATCPECGASVPVVGGRWLYVHREGSPEYAYPRGDNAARCPGSLFPVAPPSSPAHADPATLPAGALPTDADRRGQVAGG
jgi:hypothetical protein